MAWGLFGEIVAMSWDTLISNKLRSFLTILGIVIGITSIVGITSLIRGFDQSFKDQIKTLGPSTIFVSKFSGLSMTSGANFQDLMRRPNVSLDDATAIERNAPSIQTADVIIGQGGTRERVYYKGEQTTSLVVLGTSARYPDLQTLPIDEGRFFTEAEVTHRRQVIVLGKSPAEALFPAVDPIGKAVRLGNHQYNVIGVLGQQPNLLGIGDPDAVAIITYTAYQKQFGIRAINVGGGAGFLPIMVGAVPREGVSVEQAKSEIENVMRIRHGLRLDEPNDFDLVTQDAVLALWEQLSQATFLVMIAISSIALMVGGIGVMSIMTISVTERTREIGVRKALGARRVEILWQFLFEAVFLTSTGGALGILAGASLGMLISALTSFPVSLPWWSFALGIGFSASVGVFFGMVPAIRASRLDPIEALRYE